MKTNKQLFAEYQAFIDANKDVVFEDSWFRDNLGHRKYFVLTGVHTEKKYQHNPIRAICYDAKDDCTYATMMLNLNKLVPVSPEITALALPKIKEFLKPVVL